MDVAIARTAKRSVSGSVKRAARGRGLPVRAIAVQLDALGFKQQSDWDKSFPIVRVFPSDRLANWCFFKQTRRYSRQTHLCLTLPNFFGGDRYWCVNNL
ncbi:hypothetical protein CKA32_007067 [Geitlerinema sp. FC II]|nr:hypothetical protein CKA32_007067 [Geitlerinema sp. FC II]